MHRNLRDTVPIFSPFFVLFGVCLFAIMAVKCSGRTWKGDELLKKWREAAWRIGPFRIQPILKLSDAGYDTNVYRSPYDPVKDYRFTAGPAFDVYLKLKKRLMLSFSGSPQYVYYLETKRERAWNYELEGDAHLIFNRFVVSVGGGYSDARQRWNTEIDIRPRRKEKSARASFLWQMTKKTSFSFGVKRGEYDYENIEYWKFRIGERLNHSVHYVNAAVYYQMTFRTRFTAEAEYGSFNFKNPLSLRDSKSLGIYGGFEFSPTGRIRGQVKLGYKFFSPEQVHGQDYRGLVGDTSVKLMLLRRLSVRAGFRRDVFFSLWYENVYFLMNRTEAGLSFYVHRNIRLDYDYSLGRNQYPGTEALPGFSSTEKRRDDYTVHAVAVYFRIKNNIGLGMTFSRWERDSSIFLIKDRRDFIGLNLTYDF